MVDFAKFRQLSVVKDTEEDMKEIAAMKQSSPIPEGIHEVVVVGIHEKDGEKLKMSEKAGGSVGFSLVVRNAQKQEQMIYFIIPMAVSFLQACKDPDKGTKFMFTKSNRMLQTIGISPIALKESLLASDGKSIDSLVGTQFVIVNSWDSRKIHLEYDPVAKAHYFVTSQGSRFPSGEMAAPQVLDHKAPIKDRYKEVTAVAYENGYQLASQMDTTVEPHPTASNDKINALLQAACAPREVKKPVIVNKTIPAFPKRMAIPEDIEPDLE